MEQAVEEVRVERLRPLRFGRSWPAHLLFLDGIYIVAVYLLTLFFLGRNLHAMNVRGRTYVAFIGWAPPTYRLIGCGMVIMAALLTWNAGVYGNQSRRPVLWSALLTVIGCAAVVDPGLQASPTFALTLYVVSLAAAYAALTRKRGFR